MEIFPKDEHGYPLLIKIYLFLPWVFKMKKKKFGILFEDIWVFCIQ